ncbi:hypothetical protein Tco_1008103 [Tanacetum coccineum]
MNQNGTSVNTKFAKPPTSGTKLHSVTPFPKSQFIPKFVGENDLTKTVTSHLHTKKIIEKCTKVLALGLLKIKSEPINAYFQNNRAVLKDYLKVTKEHISTLQELLKEARVLKPLDEHISHASKFAERIQELLVYVSASCPFIESGNDKWAPATCHKKNNKPYVDASRSKQTEVNDTKKHAIVEIGLWYLDSGCSKHMTGHRDKLINFVSKFIGTIRFGNDHFAAIMGYEDL